MFAGINAALWCRGEAPWLPRRDEAYLGVLVDALITKGVTEPYRMFTSRAEYRLQLREDNADLRLTETGRRLGLVDDARRDVFCRKRDAVSRETERLRSIWISPRNLEAAEAVRVLGKEIDHEYSLADLLRRPTVSYRTLMTLNGGQFAPTDLVWERGVSADQGGEPVGAAAAEVLFGESVIDQVETMARYSGYIDRQKGEVERAEYYENLVLPSDLDYLQVVALSFEARQILAKHRPQTLGLASRISGITPASISLLLVHLKRNRAGRGAITGSIESGQPGQEKVPA